jgi:hypothetical protein
MRCRRCAGKLVLREKDPGICWRIEGMIPRHIASSCSAVGLNRSSQNATRRMAVVLENSAGRWSERSAGCISSDACGTGGRSCPPCTRRFSHWVVRSSAVDCCKKVFVRGSKFKPNDLHDIHHAVSAIPYCDWFFTEHGLRQLVSNKKLRFSSLFKCRTVSSIGEAVSAMSGLI